MPLKCLDPSNAKALCLAWLSKISFLLRLSLLLIFINKVMIVLDNVIKGSERSRVIM